jgi:hypothetical protein
MEISNLPLHSSIHHQQVGRQVNSSTRRIKFKRKKTRMRTKQEMKNGVRDQTRYHPLYSLRTQIHFSELESHHQVPPEREVHLKETVYHCSRVKGDLRGLVQDHLLDPVWLRREHLYWLKAMRTGLEFT